MIPAEALPPGFEDLEPFVAHWAGETTHARMNTRATSDITAIRDFYDAMIGRADEAIAYCERFPIDALPDDAARLFRLILGLAQAAIAIEIHGQPRAPGTPWPHSIRLERGATPFG
jgi:hypothetical protein